MTILRYIRSILLAVVFLGLAGKAAAQKWVTPTPEEIAMKSVPEAPGAAAVILSRDQITDDRHYTTDVMVRIKVLSEGGVSYANVNLPYTSGGTDVRAVTGRTIRPDGLISPFDGKVREEIVEKQGGFKYKQKTFTMPMATVGCILEYHYQLYSAHSVDSSQEWHLQDELFERSVRYSWIPSNYYSSLPGVQVAWSSSLPRGTAVKRSQLNDGDEYKVELSNVPPLPREDYMPPADNVGYQVHFYYTTYQSPDEFWEKAGADWAKERDQFIGPGPKVKEFVSHLTTPEATQEQTLRKIYAAVVKIENTDFTRERTRQEDKAQGLKPVVSTEDLVARGRGDSDQLTQLFVAMARAAGMKAYLMAVADRTERMFSRSYLSFHQLGDAVAIVRVNGTEEFFDPGAGACPYGELAWYDSESGGLRQAAEGGAELARTPDTDFKASVTQRTADLVVDEHGLANGRVRISYKGSPAQRWRRAGMSGDETSLQKSLRENLEKMLPEGFEVKLGTIEHVDDLTQTLVINYEVNGAVGVATGKRLLLPANLFETTTKPRFTQEMRKLPIDMHYASAIQDTIRLKLPAGFTVEAAPAPVSEKMPNVAIFESRSHQGADSITLSRDLVVGKDFLGPDQYPALRKFFGVVEAKDQDKVVLIRSSGAAPGGM